jgi:hypothetical protein
MKLSCWTCAFFFALGVALPALRGDTKPDDTKKEDGFVPMFNGKDLSGWVNVNCAPGTFFVKDNQIITTGKPTGYLRTAKQYENFIAEFEWMHVPPKPDAVGNSGFFVWADPIPAIGTGYTRGIEVQVLVNLEWKDKKSGKITACSFGDIFSIWGAKCKPDRPHPLGWERCIPSENRAKGANEWNHYRVHANDGIIKLAVNGKVVSGVSKCSPRKGYLALESEGSECRFRNLKIKELPSTKPKASEIAEVDQGHKSLYSGLDLEGWYAEKGAKKHWHANDTVLHYDGKGEAKDNALQTEKKFRDAEFITDFKFPSKGKECTFVVRAKENGLVFNVTPDGSFVVKQGGKILSDKGAIAKNLKKTEWNRLQITTQGKKFTVALNGAKLLEGDVPEELPKRGPISLEPSSGMDFANLFARELGGE